MYMITYTHTRTRTHTQLLLNPVIRKYTELHISELNTVLDYTNDDGSYI